MAERNERARFFEGLAAIIAIIAIIIVLFTMVSLPVLFISVDLWYPY